MTRTNFEGHSAARSEETGRFSSLITKGLDWLAGYGIVGGLYGTQRERFSAPIDAISKVSFGVFVPIYFGIICEQSSRARTSRMIRTLRKLGHRVELQADPA